MKKIKANLVLGCNGYIGKNDFIFCNGTSNKILDLEEVSDDKYLSLLSFLENSCGLFTSVIDDYNKCTNILNYLYKNFNIINTDQLQNIQYHLHMHKNCAPYLILVLKEDF